MATVTSDAQLQTAASALRPSVPAARKRFPATVDVFGHTLSIGTEIGIVIVFAAIFIALAIRGFSRTE